MEEKTSIVRSCKLQKTWKGKLGATNYNYRIELENGDSGVYQSFGGEDDISHKEITYTMDCGTAYGDIIKISNMRSIKRNVGPHLPENDKMIYSQSAMKAAVALCCGNKIKLDDIEKWHKKIFDMQNKLGNSK